MALAPGTGSVIARRYDPRPRIANPGYNDMAGYPEYTNAQLGNTPEGLNAIRTVSRQNFLAPGTGGAAGGSLPALANDNPYATGASTPNLPGGYGGDYAARAWERLKPIWDAQSEIINRRGAQASGAIGQYGNILQGMAGAYAGQVPGIYGPEIKSLRAEAELGRGELIASGKGLQSNLNNALAQSGFTSKQAGLNNTLTKQGKGAAAAAYGTGIAAVDELIAKQAASATRAALEPSFAQGLTQNDQGLLAMQVARQLSDLQTNLSSQIPGIIDTLQQRDLEAARDQRDYEERVREFGITERRLSAGDTATNRYNRLTQFMNLQKQREDATGYQWEITSTGVRPRLVNGRRVPTSDQRQQQIENITALNLDANGNLTPAGKAALARLGVTTSGTTEIGVKTAATYAKMLQTHQDAMARLGVAQQNANTAVARARIAQQRADEIARFNTWKMQHPNRTVRGMASTGTAPRRVGPSTWRTRPTKANPQGRPLDTQQTRYWEALYHAGYINSRGKLLHPIPPGWAPGDPAYGGGGGGSGKPPTVQ